MAEIGSVLGGRYRLVELLGEGGMATIYRAQDAQLGRDVAVKVLRPEYGRDPDFFTRFRQEAQSAASLNSPNIVSVYDYGQDPAGPFIVMEYVDGEDLATLLKRNGALAPRQAARVAAEVARALAVAHARGIVHRDIKPGNILIAADGRVKVTDFGIARAISEAQLTLPGMTLGSVHYFSPEQARGEPATAASDTYALGIVLYECLSGRRPWEGDSAAAVAIARLSGPIPGPTDAMPSVPKALDAIDRRALALEPRARFGDAAEMADELDAFLAGMGPTAARGRAPAAVAAGAAAGPVGGAAAAGAGAPGAPAAGAGAARAGASGAPTAGIPATGATGGSGVAGPAQLAGPAQVAGPAGAPSPTSPLPHPVDAYAGGPTAPPEQPPSARTTAEGAGGGTSPWVWISGILGLIVIAVAGYLIYQVLSGTTTPAVEQVGVPNFVGSTLDASRVTADSLGLELVETAQESDQPIGTILAQDPAADTKVDKGSQVTVTVATGTETVAVPDLRLRTEADALAAIFQAGLTNGTRSDTFDAIVPAGSVVGQDPQAGIRVARGTAVNYVVSKGPEPTPSPSPSPPPTPEPTATPTATPEPTLAPITVGDYRCLTLDGATQQLTAEGFALGTVATSPPGGLYDGTWLVQAQVPLPGETRPPGTPIRLTVIDPSNACP